MNTVRIKRYISEVLDIIKKFTHINFILSLLGIFLHVLLMTEKQKEAQNSSVYNY